MARLIMFSIFPYFGSNKVRRLNLFILIYLFNYFNQVNSSRDVTFGIRANVLRFWGTWGVSLLRLYVNLCYDVEC